MESFLWWHWIVLGIVLVMLELVVPSFTIFWFGLGAILTGLLVAGLPGISLEWQLLVFSSASIVFTLLWFRYFSPRRKAMSPVADERAAIGQTGIAATRALIPGELGRVVFSVPVLGGEAWDYVADQPIHTGDRLRVIAVLTSEIEESGQRRERKILRVEKTGR